LDLISVIGGDEEDRRERESCERERERERESARARGVKMRDELWCEEMRSLNWTAEISLSITEANLCHPFSQLFAGLYPHQ
jgi:hypothetical protein